MSSIADPTRVWRRRGRAAWTLLVGVLGAGAIWAAAEPRRPAPERAAPDLASAPEAEPPPPPDDAFDLACFGVALWVEPPAPEPRRAPAESAARAASRVQLLAIVTETTPSGAPRYRAAVYDPDQDRIVFVTDGDTVGAHAVRAVDASGMTLAASGTETRIDLDPLDGGRS